MRPAKDLDEFLSDPADRYVSGRRWLVFAADRIGGMIVWDNPSPEDAAHVVRSLPASLKREPHGYLIDARRMSQQVDPASFTTVVEQAGPTLPQYGGRVTRCAVVLPAGMGAAVVMGFFTIIGAPFEVRFFADPIAALEYAGQPDPRSFLATLDALQEKASGTPALLFRLRALLDGHPAGASVQDAARQLSLSTRSLQRRLIEARTSFRAELLAARLRKAQRLLVDSDEKITAIALEVGCGSSQHLSALFRKMTGETPSEWRASHRLS
ncbi:MAG: helix-turn-helix domain-containing protein [Myxococcales bacterium]